VWESCSRASIIFKSPAESQEGEPLNYIVENDVTQAALDTAMGQCKNLSVVYSCRVSGYQLPREEEGEQQQLLARNPVRVLLQGGDTIQTSLLIGADGFRSEEMSCVVEN
jgi:2-polyprenyl-6-methoxyphenol hydroxylase-like FAD-dependent oxidoreductase